MTGICMGCSASPNRTTAASHEATTGHTVTVWDSPSSQLPRTLWAPATGATK